MDKNYYLRLFTQKGDKKIIVLTSDYMLLADLGVDIHVLASLYLEPRLCYLEDILDR
jgi:hypothetical protein